MIAHKVVEDLVRCRDEHKNDEDLFKYFNGLACFVNDSIKFDLGNADDLRKLFHSSFKNGIISLPGVIKDNLKYIKPPFKLTFFEFDIASEDGSTNKIGVSLNNLSGGSKKVAKLKISDRIDINNELLFIQFLHAEDCHLGKIFFPNMHGIIIDLHDGSIIPIANKWLSIFKNENPMKNNKNYINEAINEDMRSSKVYSIITCFALILLNCKNISTIKEYPSEALNRKRIKQGKRPLFSYYTLVLNLLNDKQNNNKQYKKTGIEQRIHFCRGHFKEYTETNKLFGKYTGLYWWQPQVRGNKELGIVHKDYEVKAA